MEETSPRLRLPDFLLIAIYSFVLFGYAGISGRPLTMHEARLPQTAREMKQHGNWLLPMSGARPWLERPPLPHWIVAGSMKVFGSDNTIWVVRLPSAIMGMMTVLVIAGIACGSFGRTIGLLSGLVLASSFEFYAYSGLAEDDIYLAALVAICMALFICTEFCSKSEEPALGFFKNRNWKIWAFFIFLGLTNLAKGPLLGVAVVGVTVGTYLLWTAAQTHWKSLRRYLWFWGWLILIALTLLWPAYAHYRYPDVLANWKYDYLGRVNGTYTDINQPWYYYAPALAVAMLPWSPACLIGLLATAGNTFLRKPTPDGAPADSAKLRALRLVWCWAFAPLILFSIPKGKHHHYLIPFLAPWAILAAFGAVEIGRWILSRPGPRFLRNPLVGLCLFGFPAAIAIAWFHDKIPSPPRLTILVIIFWLDVVAAFFISLQRASARLLLTTILLMLLIGYCWAEKYLAAISDHTLDDTAFLHRAAVEVPPNLPLFIDADLEPTGNLDFFRIQFYSPSRAVLLHNLTYLRDENVHEAKVFVIARSKDIEFLQQLGSVVAIDQSAQSHDPPPGWTQAQSAFTLFELKFDPNLKRYPAPARITNLQAMQRDRTGPWCGPAL